VPRGRRRAEILILRRRQSFSAFCMLRVGLQNNIDAPREHSIQKQRSVSDITIHIMPAPISIAVRPHYVHSCPRVSHSRGAVVSLETVQYI